MTKKKELPDADHGLTEKNTRRFQKELTTLLKKYASHVDGSKIQVKTSTLKFTAEDIVNCPPECVRRAEVCDINGRNCVVKVWCECDE